MTIDDTLVVARTPLRLSLGGGGTDLPFYRSRFGADILSVAISPTVTVVARRGRLDGTYKYGYADIDHAAAPSGIRDAFVRAALAMASVDDPCEIYSLGPVPSGTGLGSSGAFSVSLLAALYKLSGHAISRAELLEQACSLEIDRLGRPVGKQDAYACGLGGLNRLVINRSGSVEVTPTGIADTTLQALEQHLVLLYTGVRRSAATQLAASSEADLNDRIERLHRIRQIGDRLRAALQAGDWQQTPALIREHWAVKRERQQANSSWAMLCSAAEGAGAGAWKLVGAGGGGFLLVWVEPERRQRVIESAEAFGAKSLRFRFTNTGTTVTEVST